MSITVIEFVTMDGVVEDPDGTGGTPGGGWMFRWGPEAVSGDKFQLGPLMDEGVLLLGRRTWEQFAKIWPSRDDPFSRRMNAMAKLVASRRPADASAWVNSEPIEGDLVDAVKRETRDVVVAGSLSVVRTLMEHDLIDEYRLITFPVILGAGERLFPSGGTPVYLRTLSTSPVGACVRTAYGRAL